MSEELAQSGSDVNTSEESSAPTESTTSNGSEASAPKEAATSQESKEQYVPYDRFKELIEQKNQFAKQFEDQQKLIKDLQSKFESQAPKTVSESQKMIQTLKERGVEPEFLKFLEQMDSSRSELEQLKQWRAQAERQQYNTSAKATTERLQSELKVPKQLHDAFMAQIPYGTSIDDISKQYKNLHAEMNKYLDTYARDKLAEYSKAKKTDSKLPTSNQKTAAPKAAKDMPLPKNKEDARKMLSKAIVDEYRAIRAANS